MPGIQVCATVPGFDLIFVQGVRFMLKLLAYGCPLALTPFVESAVILNRVAFARQLCESVSGFSVLFH